MASILSLKGSLVFLFSILFFLSNSVIVNGNKPHIFSREKLTRLHIYFHDFVTSPNPTAVRVAEAPTTNTSRTSFGVVMVADNPLTETAELSSRPLGRAQCLYSSVSQKEVSLLMAINFVFSDGKYNGSSLTVLGRNAVFSKVREMPVVGGSGAFRFARGYVLLKTNAFNATTLNAIVELDFYVLHY